MAHSLFRLASSIYNTPHAVSPASLNVVLDYLEHRNGDVEFARFNDSSRHRDEDDEKYPNGLGILRVDGTLTYRPVMTMCGEVGTSYQSLVRRTEEMAKAGVSTIVMEVSSGGGQATCCFETAQEIREICDDNGISLIGYADEMAASAAYALLCVCDTVIANPSAMVGSIGVVVALLDDSKAMSNAGLKRIFLTAGQSKVPFEADGTFKESFLEDIQARVDTLNEEFLSHVSAHTGLDTEVVRGFEAKTFDAKTALSNGLVNSVMTAKEFAQYIAHITKEPNEA